MSQENFDPLYEWAEKTRSEFAVAYDLEGIKKIEEAILACRDAFQSWPEKERYAKIHAFGAFLGQCMILNSKGEWCRNGDSIGIKLEEQGIWADPFQKVWKQFQQEGHSISSFYEMSSHARFFE